MKRSLVQQDGLSTAKKTKAESDEEELVLPTRAPGLSSVPLTKPTPKLASIFQPRTLTTSASSTNGTSTSTGLKWLDPIGASKTCLHGLYGGPQPNAKVAFYDLDGTIVRPKNHKTFPSKTDEYDFEFLFSTRPAGTLSVIERIRQQHLEGFAIVVITNQKQTAYAAKSGLATWKKKMGHIAGAIDVPMRVFAALGDDEYRKPRLGMWTEFLRQNGGVELDKEQSFFVGDAAGRKKYRDHQDTDLKWALNAGIGFYTPEEYFLKRDKEYEVPMRPWSPSALKQSNGTLKGLVSEPEDDMVTVELSSIDKDAGAAGTILGSDHDAKAPEIVLFVGAPASGKTFLFNRIFEPASYVHVNQDTLRTREKCLRVVRDTVDAGQSCVVDNTNRDRATRKHYIDLARTLNARIRCIYFDVPKHVCVHNNHFRAHHGPTSSEEVKRSLLPYTAIESWFKDRQPPRREEGFDAEVVRVVWGWSGGDEEVEKMYKMYYH
ncbi:hypothetical protein PHSY_002047 [Pseudozyma hubeiensis SY62]|uniref:Bifunctional polynucleotide phosphatase/kinase n=1 Tax=Pseudozyma hubeiensis (strain SY62) TaxID=1305764 RepID=R9P8R4_PSEHS|nr:hypothetical protein PHSY_002047 [Pseudozyma hubeiensis SY62]GAC94475.1 hypothetical protein PHSY_002047 [Pseudozyma hubeiensis SY62]